MERYGEIAMDKRPELSDREKRLPVARFYNTALNPPDPLRRQLIDAGPIDPEDAIKAENFLDFIKPEGIYHKVEYGYCMMPDGTGYIALYDRMDPRVTQDMYVWYMRWINFRPRSAAAEDGNIRYKLWMPADHIDHCYVNGSDKTNGSRTLERGGGERALGSVRHAVAPRDVGITAKLEEELLDAGYRLRLTWETFDIPGSSFCFEITRPCPLGGMETLTRKWIGWKPEGGWLVKDPFSPVSEEYLQKALIHNTVERQHLPEFLPELYKEYRDKPIDAD